MNRSRIKSDTVRDENTVVQLKKRILGEKICKKRGTDGVWKHCSYQPIIVVTVNCKQCSGLQQEAFFFAWQMAPTANYPPIINWYVKSNFPTLGWTYWPGCLNDSLGSPKSAAWPWCHFSIRPGVLHQITWSNAQAFELLHVVVCSEINSNKSSWIALYF